MQFSGRPAPHPASFRDPSGFVFRHEDAWYRFVDPGYAPHYDRLMGSGLYRQLTEEGSMIRHSEVSSAGYEDAYKVLRPEQLPFWSYPYEWSFRQLKDAALTTLQLTKKGLAQGMILKDANAYNIQFFKGNAVLIDSLSFEIYEEGKPWMAFRQFCDHFLYPLLLQARNPSWNPALLMAFPDGLPAPFTASLMPRSSRLSLNNQLYLFLPAALSGKSGGKKRNITITKEKILQNLDQLHGYISKLDNRRQQSNWKGYYQETILSEQYLHHKSEVVARILSELRPRRVTDIGCNTGAFSLLAAKFAEEVIALDTDSSSVEALYLAARAEALHHLHAIVGDICNPAPALGWENAERAPLLSRIGCDLCLALALVHHLALSKNVPLPAILRMLAGITGKWLLIEFVPKADPKAQLLLQHKEDIYTGYDQAQFEAAAAAHFTIESATGLKDSLRTLYLLRKKV